MRTGCFVKMCPQSILFSAIKILTLSTFIIFGAVNISHAESIFGQEKSSTYLRWNLFTNRDQLQFNKVGNKVIIKTLNENLYQSLKEEFANSSFESHYINNVVFKDTDKSSNVFSIEVILKDESVEMFSFYREREKKYVVDFWKDSDSGSLLKGNTKAEVSKNELNEDRVNVKMAQKEPVEVVAPEKKTISPNINPKKVSKPKARKVSNIEEAKAETEAKDIALVEKVKEDKILSNLIVDPNKKIEKTEEELAKENDDAKKPYRDFRYGATFLWDYDPIVPAFKGVVNLETKIPENFYQIPNRDFKKNEREAHLQLTINLYRKKKWGLMYKSIKLFQQKFGQTAEWELLEYIKANAILRENVDTPNPELFKNAIAILGNLVEKSDNYEIKKSIYKYLLTYYMQKSEHLKTLQIAKNFYAGTRDNFDFEESLVPAEAMLNSLAKLGQIEKIQELSQEKSMKKLLPAQLLLAYQTFAYLRLGDTNGLVGLYEKVKPSLAKPIDPVILYNTAEAYFRLGKYQEASNIFQEFVTEYSHEFVASNANLRIALCSDLLDKNYNDTIELYKKAIDTAIDNNVSYEARVRYVAFRTIRKRVLNDQDKEIRIFLEQDKKFNGTVDKNLARLLQQVRLRSMIVDGKYKEALSYLSLIPMITMSKIDARIFDGDGAEIVYGIISDFYKKAEYSQVIKAWQTYKDKYIDKVAMDPFINFVVGSSYVKLGLYKGFDEMYAAFEKIKDTPSRTFPIWVERQTELKASDLLSELEIIKDLRLKNWDLASKNIAKFEKRAPGYNRTNYYKGMISYNLKEYKEAVTHLENFFSKQDQRVIYDPSDVADMIRAYTDSIYEQGQTDKFLKVSDAILNDTNSIGANNAYIQNVRERIAYLGIEIASSKGTKENFMIFDKKIEDFKKANPKSIYLGRVGYLQGLALIQNQKIKEGKELLNNLVNDKNVSDYIKELAKSELSLINIKEKTL
jgi:hypothetical protein